MSWPKLQKVVSIAFLVTIIASFVIYQIYSDEFEVEKLRDHVASFGVWSPLVFLVLFVLGTIFIPASPFMIAAGILFGFTYGLIYTLIGSLLSAVIVFIGAKKLGQEGAEKMLKYKYLKPLGRYNERRLESGGVWDLVFLRLLPIMPFNVLNILMGVSKISIRDYILGTVIGIIPNNAATIYLGILVIKLF